MFHNGAVLVLVSEVDCQAHVDLTAGEVVGDGILDFVDVSDPVI